MTKNKFKAWNDGEWVDPQEFTLDDLVEFSERYKFLQFTGALDKNQKQIFEGDIVLFDNPDPYDGKDQLTKTVGYNCRTMSFRLYNFPEDVGNKAGSSFYPEDVEVIGNIFEGAIKDGINYGEYLKEK